MNGVRWSKIYKNEQFNKIIIIGSGPSLKDFDANILKDLGYYIIVINNAFNICNFANAWFTLDPWGLDGRQLPPINFKGDLFAAVPEDFGLSNARITDHKISIQASRKIQFLHRIVFHTDVNSIKNGDYLNWGLSEDPSCINTLNSGYGALNLAYHMKPDKILLLGIDASTGYFNNVNQKTRSLSHLPLIFESTIPQLQERNITVINGSINSNITCFKRLQITEALEEFNK